MDPNILTTLGSMLAVLAGMLGITAYLRSDLKEVKDDLKGDLKEVKDDLKGDLKEVKGDLKEVKDDLKEDIKEVKDDLKEDIREVKDDLKEVNTDIRRVDDRVWQLSSTIIQHHLGVSPDDLPDIPEPEYPARDRDRAQN